MTDTIYTSLDEYLKSKHIELIILNSGFPALRIKGNLDRAMPATFKLTEYPDGTLGLEHRHE